METIPNRVSAAKRRQQEKLQALNLLRTSIQGIRERKNDTNEFPKTVKAMRGDDQGSPQVLSSSTCSSYWYRLLQQTQLENAQLKQKIQELEVALRNDGRNSCHGRPLKLPQNADNGTVVEEKYYDGNCSTGSSSSGVSASSCQHPPQSSATSSTTSFSSGRSSSLPSLEGLEVSTSRMNNDYIDDGDTDHYFVRTTQERLTTIQVSEVSQQQEQREDSSQQRRHDQNSDSFRNKNLEKELESVRLLAAELACRLAEQEASHEQFKDLMKKRQLLPDGGTKSHYSNDDSATTATTASVKNIMKTIRTAGQEHVQHWLEERKERQASSSSRIRHLGSSMFAWKLGHLTET